MRAKIMWTAIILFFLTACDVLGSADAVTATPGVPLTAEATLLPTPVLSTTPSFTSSLTTTVDTRPLIIWTPPELLSRSDMGTALLLQQINNTADEMGIQVTVEQKAVTGQGGMLSYLRNGRNTAPSILPDLIALPTDLLADAADEAVIFPLETYLDGELVDDLYPAGVTLVQMDEHLLGYPFVFSDITHMVINRGVFEEDVPAAWSDMLLTDGLFVFPAAGSEGASLALQFYLESGGVLSNEAGQPYLEVEPLAEALENFRQARETGFILPQSSSIGTMGEVWQVFNNGTAILAQTTASRFLEERTNNELTLGFGSFPGLEERLPVMARGWAWGVSTPDPARQAVAAEFLSRMVAAENLSIWTQESNLVPASRSALASWPQNDQYVLFLQQELPLARPYPVTANSAILDVLGDAVFDVVSLTKTPQVAAEDAVNGLRP